MLISGAASLCNQCSLNPSDHRSREEHGCRLFGLTVSKDFDLSIALPSSHDTSELSLTLSSHPLQEPAAPPIYVSPLRNRHGSSLGLLYHEPQGEVLHFSKAGGFRIRPDIIEAYIPDSERDLAELRLLGPVLSYWFERRGLPTLHASAVSSVRGFSIAFVSRHGGGKSGLGAAMVREGFRFLTDDLLILEERDTGWEARPSYPCMRMWPDEAKYFLDDYTDLPRVRRGVEKRNVAIGKGGFGSFLDASVPLACIYLASRRPE